MPHQADLMHAQAQILPSQTANNTCLSDVLILVATLLGSSMPANPPRYFGVISACGSLVMINTSKSNLIHIDGLLLNSCQDPVEFPLKFDRRPVDFQSVTVGFPMDS